MHRPQNRRTRMGPSRAGLLAGVAALFILTANAMPVAASGPRTDGGVQSLDQQVQDIKSDVLSIAAELRALEERLLHPSSTQVSVFVEIGDDQTVLVDSTRVWIDDDPIAHHVYSHIELDALHKGGVQRLYTGNLSEGTHTLRVAIEGRRSGSGRFEHTEVFPLRKAVGPKKVGITLQDSLTGGAQIAIADW